MAEARKPGRTRVERGIYRQPNGKYAVCARRTGRLHFCTAGDPLWPAAETVEASRAGAAKLDQGTEAEREDEVDPVEDEARVAIG